MKKQKKSNTKYHIPTYYSMNTLFGVELYLVNKKAKK